MNLITSTLQTLIEHGGVAGYLILSTAVILAAIGLERLISLFFRMNFKTEAAIEDIKGLIFEHRYTEALQICNKQERAPTLNVIKSGLIAVESGREAMRASISNSVLTVSTQCERGLSYLSLIANVATLLGLFGTILGLIKTFAAIAQVDPSEKGRLLGIGISEAMYTTAAGLFVGISAMVIHTICISKSDDIVGKAQNAGLNLMTWIEQSERSQSHVNRRAV